MSLARLSLSVFGVVGLLAATLAGATIWLLLTDPVTGAGKIAAAAGGDVSPLLKAVAGVLYEALRGLINYL